MDNKNIELMLKDLIQRSARTEARLVTLAKFLGAEKIGAPTHPPKPQPPKEMT